MRFISHAEIGYEFRVFKLITLEFKSVTLRLFNSLIIRFMHNALESCTLSLKQLLLMG